MGIRIILVSLILLVAGCAGTYKDSQSDARSQGYTVGQNIITVTGGPIIRVDDSFRYGGAEIVPSLGKGVKRQIFAGPGASFLTVTVFDAGSQTVLQAVTASANPKWEYKVKEITGPRQWIRITGNKTPCCVNLLRSEYIFVPKKGGWQKLATLPGGDVPGKIVLISYGVPIPEHLSPNSWTVSDDGAVFLNGENDPGLNFEPDVDGLLIPGLSPERRAFLAKQEELAAQVYQVE